MQTNSTMLAPSRGITLDHRLGLRLEDHTYGASTEQVRGLERADVARRHLAESRRHDAEHDAHLQQALLMAKRGSPCGHSGCQQVYREIARLIIAAQGADAREDDQVGEGDGHVERCQGHLRAAGVETRAIGGLLEFALFGRTRGVD